MDTFNFLVAILLVIIVMQFNMSWMVLGIVAIMIFSTRSLSTAILLLGTTAVLFFLGSENINAYFPFLVVGIIVAAIVFGIKGGGGEQPEMYAPSGYGDLLGGM